MSPNELHTKKRARAGRSRVGFWMERVSRSVTQWSGSSMAVSMAALVKEQTRVIEPAGHP